MGLWKVPISRMGHGTCEVCLRRYPVGLLPFHSFNIPIKNPLWGVGSPVWELAGYATSKCSASIRIIPSKKSLTSSRNETNHSNCFWKMPHPGFTSWRIAFNRDLVVTVSQPHELNLIAFVEWSKDAMLWPCSLTVEQLVDSLNSTAVFDLDQFALFERAKFICFSIWRMVEIRWYSYMIPIKNPLSGVLLEFVTLRLIF